VVVTVTLLLVAPHIEAETLVVPGEPEVVVPLPSVMVARMAVLEIFQVAKLVTSVVPVTPLKVASSTNVTAVLPGTVALVPPLSTVSLSVCTTGHTFTVCVELVTVPREALTVVVPGRVVRFASPAAVIRPGLEKFAMLGLLEVHTDWPVASFVLPSLYVAVATI
jgi:hypothetical protein